MTPIPTLRAVLQYSLILLMIVALPGCRTIGNILEVGVWAGVIMVAIIIVVVGFIASMFRRRR